MYLKGTNELLIGRLTKPEASRKHNILVLKPLRNVKLVDNILQYCEK